MERSLEYNTQRSQLKLREYGRNVQNLVAHLKTIEDEESRDRKAATIVELMKLINPDLNKDSIEYDQKIWDDLYIISGFEVCSVQCHHGIFHAGIINVGISHGHL